ncbi:MAG: hydantoinase/oxoprolinase family protein [Chloroflexi bacterium]|nr:hydantoinase/oxoprolinase family protein [Chloroflexota bacterium]
MVENRDSKYIIYLDTGGTFSDAVIVREDGSFVRGKAPTTPDDLESCFFDCVEDGAEKLNKPLNEVLANTVVLGFGTTAGTNALLTKVGGPKVGLITTRGFEDTLGITRLRAVGLESTHAMHIAAAEKPLPLVPRTLIAGVTERTDSLGREVIRLYEGEARGVVRELLDKGVEGIAVCFLWSFLNDAHERRMKEIIEEIAPEVPVSLSCDVAPLVREYPRLNSTIVNLYISGPVRRLFSKIDRRLGEYGYKKPLLVMQGSGGLSRSSVVMPIKTLNSGPVGGLVGVEFLKELYGFKNALGSDVGGTSFDVAVVTEEGRRYVREPVVSRYTLANPMLEIESVGAGGGTIAYVDKVTGLLHVGPGSAGAVPGPVCYDRGGTEPTVTDADVVLNRIDPEYFLAGKMRLDRAKAEAAIKEKIADPMGMTVLDAAEAICDVIDNSMKSLLVSLLGQRGLDPAKFVCFAFGGAGPTHCAGYSAGVGFPKVIIPPYAATFSAFGASTAEIMHRYEQSPYLVMPGLPFDVTTDRFAITSLEQIPEWVIDRFNSMFAGLEQRALEEMEEEGFGTRQVRVTRHLAMRYGGQLYEIECKSPVSAINTVEDIQAIVEAFEEEYERVYTRMAMYPRGGLEIISIALEVSAPPAAKPAMVKHRHAGEDARQSLKGRRQVYFGGGFVNTPVFAMDLLQAGNAIDGPAIIEGQDTTMVVPPGRRIEVDEYLNMTLYG